MTGGGVGAVAVATGGVVVTGGTAQAGNEVASIVAMSRVEIAFFMVTSLCRGSLNSEPEFPS
jgi:pyrimidine deaminase RibD-like protein